MNIVARLSFLAIFLLLTSGAGAQTEAVAAAVEALQRGDAARAEAILRTELGEHPRNAEALGVLAVVLDQEKQYSAAEEFYKRALAVTPKSAPLLNNYGNHLIATGQIDAARDAFHAVLAVAPGHPNASLQLARIAVRKKAPQEALRYLDALPAAARSAPEPSIARMQALYELRRDTEADALLANLSSGADRDPRLSYLLGVALAASGEYDKAEQRFARALELAPGNLEVAYNLALAASHAGHNERAKEVLEGVVRAQPGNADALYDLAAVNARLGRREDALKLLAEAARIAPDRPEIQELIARTTADLGYLGDAVNAWDRYLELKPKDDVARRERAFAASAIGQDAASALATLRAYTAQHPSDAVGHYQLGVSESAEAPERALAEFDRALQLKPDLVPARVARGLMNFRQARFDLALPDFEAARKSEPDNAAVLDRLGQTYAALQRPGDAVAALRRAAELSPRDSKILLHLGRALMSAGQQEEGRAVLARFRELGPDRAANPHPAGLVDFLSLSSEEQLARYRAGVERTVKSNPQNAEAQVRYLELLLNDRKFDEAAGVARHIMELAPGADLLAQAGDALLSARQYALARIVLVKAGSPLAALATLHTDGADAALQDLDKLPAPLRNGEYLAARARVLAAAGRTDEAIASLARLGTTRVPANNPELALTRVVGLVASGRERDAESALAAIESRWADLPNAWLARAIFAQWAGRDAEAHRMLETAAALGEADAEARFASTANRKNPTERAIALLKALFA